MPKAGFIPDKLKPWIDARRRYHLLENAIRLNGDGECLFHQAQVS
jgi:hypothetical protein